MGKRLALATVVVAALAGFFVVQPAPAVKLNPENVLGGKLSMNSTLPFRGKLTAPAEDCRNGRRIRIIDADTKSFITATFSKNSRKSPSKWGRTFSFFGSAYAEAPRTEDGCQRLRSKVVDFPNPAAMADLAIAKVAAGDDFNNHAQYTITVSNLGPDAALGVTVTDDPDTTFFATGSDSRCSPDGGAVFTCALGTILPGAQVSFLVKTDCPGAANTNSASVTSLVADPNAANNATGSVASSPC